MPLFCPFFTRKQDDNASLPEPVIATERTVVLNSLRKTKIVKRTKLIRTLLPQQQAKTPFQHNSLVCASCYEQNIDVVLVPCGHLCFCLDCVYSLRNQTSEPILNCPICRRRIQRAVRFFDASTEI
jgi:hypothetical protein|uniref:RING-type domain-containing protein n=1 Tax=viral metagenome TaxID=1070528 RepID=A0A6C0IV13_9ZZZZ